MSCGKVLSVHESKLYYLVDGGHLMKKKNEVSINLNEEQLKLLKELLDSEYFQVSGAVKVSRADKLKRELSLLQELKNILEKPSLAVA